MEYPWALLLEAHTLGDKVVAAALLCYCVAPIGAGICACGVFWRDSVGGV